VAGLPVLTAGSFPLICGNGWDRFICSLFFCDKN
jgi:hypothetical protein